MKRCQVGTVSFQAADMMLVIAAFQNLWIKKLLNELMKLINKFFWNFSTVYYSKNKTFPELEKFPYCGERFWRNILSSMLQNLLFLPTEQFSTFFHKLLSSEYSKRHRSETDYYFLPLKHYMLYTVEGIVTWKCSGLLSDFFRSYIWIFVFLLMCCSNTVCTATCYEMDSMRI